MKVITDLRNKVAQAENNINSGKWVQQIIYDNEAYIVDLNAEEQLYEQGVNNLGVSISDYAPYSPVTIEIKKAKGQPTNRVTLRDEGDFESSFFLDVGQNQFEIKASDWKTEELIKKYGRQILGLTNENIEKLIWDFIYPDLLSKLKNELYG
jgi:hypothetical protein|nr:MAG TPA: hypothetical protein [Caudoviricetes sp.]